MDFAGDRDHADFVSLDDSVACGPRQADGSLPNTNFLHLAAGSDLIDKGMNVGLPFTGIAPDLGAFEYAMAPRLPATANLTWAASTDNVGVSGYYVYRDGSMIAVTSGTTYSDKGLSRRTGHSYTVRAFDAAGNVSGPSATASARTEIQPLAFRYA